MSENQQIEYYDSQIEALTARYSEYKTMEYRFRIQSNRNCPDDSFKRSCEAQKNNALRQAEHYAELAEEVAQELETVKSLRSQISELHDDNEASKESLVLMTAQRTLNPVLLNVLAEQLSEPELKDVPEAGVVLHEQAVAEVPVVVSGTEVNNWVALEKGEACPCGGDDDENCNCDHEESSFLDKSKEFFKEHWMWFAIGAAAIIVSILLSKAFKKK